MQGLCGNFNGNRSDDQISPSGELIKDVGEFGSEWLVPWVGPSEPAVCHNIGKSAKECRDVTVIETCLMLNSSSTFAQCKSVMDEEEINFLVENCISDLCSNMNLKCAVFDNFAQSCMEMVDENLNSTYPICSWHAVSECTPTCGQNSKFESCADTCTDTRTCANRETKECQQVSKKASFCACDDGYVLLGNSVQLTFFNI